MDKFNLLSIILFGMFCSVEGQSFKIWTKFMDGNLIFTWNNISTERNDIEITKDSSKPHWISVDDDQYTVEDVALYKTVRIRIREYKNRQFTDFTDHIVTFNVNTVESRVGESKNISWTIQKFPRSGDYFIFHAYIGRPRKIITVAQSVPSNSKKYFYLNKPYDSEKILFTIKNITVKDAGFYGGSDVQTDGFSGEEGVILIVYERPLKPSIRTNFKITTRNYTSLKCESRSISAPSYYKKFPPLTYSWFVNKTKLEREVRETYSFIVTKDVKYNQYSCQAKETLESEKSEKIQINPIFNTIESQMGESRNISWTAGYFPNTGVYFIFHGYKGSLSQIMKIENASLPSNEKHIYHTRPFNSVNIQIEVKNITVEDAGYYIGNPTANGAWSGENGIILAVSGKPVQPIIRGDRNVSVRYFTYLKCESRSTSAPEYYMGFPSLSYSWFVNGKLEKETSELYRFKVSKEDKYNNYSCQAKEILESVRSEEVRINPLYGPEIILIAPLRPDDEINVGRRLIIKEGDSFGPYKCSADCNPPCTVQWKYKTTSGSYIDATHSNISSITLLQQKANRTEMTHIQCIANNCEGRNEQSIKLNILYLKKPIIRLNGRSDYPSFIKEDENLNISCYVDSNPTPLIDLTRSLQGRISGPQNNIWLYHSITSASCSDTDNYTCTGKSQEFGNESTNFTLDVHCKPRLDMSVPLKTTYGSMSGEYVKVPVAVPVIANPFPSTSGSKISWDGPGHKNIKNSIIDQRDNFIYKHWINSTIPISDQNSFGNYTLYYNGEQIAIITINAEDLPKPPLNFTWISDARGHVNLTWISNFNGGPEQFFILSHKQESGWTFVENLTDPGEGNLGYYDLGPLAPGLEYLYQLESCNRINCSLSPREVKVEVKAPPISSSSLFGDNTMLILIGASATGFLLVVVLTLAVTMYCKTTKKSATKKRNRQEGLIGSTEQDDTPADVVVYAAVDKSVLMKNRQQDDVVKNDDIKDTNDDNDTMYSEVIKHPKKQQTDEKKEKKKKEENGLKENNEEAGASTSNDNSRSMNQDGLVYIDVEFARKPPSSDTKGRPVIHGEEEKTEYTFVDFSQKAPPVQETQENVK